MPGKGTGVLAVCGNRLGSQGDCCWVRFLAGLEKLSSAYDLDRLARPDDLNSLLLSRDDAGHLFELPETEAQGVD